MADVIVTASAVLPLPSATPPTQTADVTWGGTITAGTVVYKDTSDSNDAKAADCLTAAAAVVAGIALCGGADGQPGKIAIGGKIDPGFTVTVGSTYVLSQSGAIAPIADLVTGDYVSIIGHGIDASTLLLDINSTGVQVP